MSKIRYDWTIEELNELYEASFLELLSKAHLTHLQFHDPSEIQVCNLLSIKTGGCPEDCKYCAQSAYYKTPVKAEGLMDKEDVLSHAKKALALGCSRICLGAAWRQVREGKQFDQILEMVKEITDLGAEVCCTLGMLTLPQAQRLKEAGLYAYSHNLDTSEKYYKTIITTRTYQDRLNTLDIVENAGITTCCGGILGLGETPLDRMELLLTLAKRNPHPESVPINRLTAVAGTPLENQAKVTFWEMVRVVAIARIALPDSIVRLSCGRIEMSYQEQALCFFAGANSIHTGEKLLTVKNTSLEQDIEMFQLLGLKKRPAFRKAPC